MKKILSLSLLLSAALAFTGCSREEDDIFDHSAAERLNLSKVTYTERLAATSAGWAMEYYPTNRNSSPTGLGYLMLADFSSDRSVRMAMQNEMSDGQYIEYTSVWEVISDNGPVLSFNSYNVCLHAFSDPAIYDTGLGFEGDYEFVILDLPENAEFATLKGKKRGTYIRLTRLDEGTDFKEYLADINDFTNEIFPRRIPYMPILTLDGKQFSIAEGYDGLPSIYLYQHDAISYESRHPYIITQRGGEYYLRFRNALCMQSDSLIHDHNAIENDSVVSAQEFRFDTAAGKFFDVNNAANTIDVEFPAAIDFYNKYIANKHQFYVARNGQNSVSDKMREYFNTASTGIASINKSYKIDSLAVNITNDNQISWKFKYQTGKSAQYVQYLYNYQTEGDAVTYTYDKPEAKNGENIMNRVEGIKVLMQQVLSQKFVVTPFTTRFNLTKLRFTAEADPDLWFIVNY